MKTSKTITFTFESADSSLVSRTAQTPAKKKTPKVKSHVNFMAGTSFDISNPLLKLKVALSSCFFGEPSYYDSTSRLNTQQPDASVRACVQVLNPLFESPQTVSDLERMIDEALSADAEGTLKEAVTLRNVDNIRKAPQVIMVRAANHPAVRGTSLISQYAPSILCRGDEPAVQLEYQLKRFGKPIPNALKKAWKTFLEKQGDYQLAKYATGDGDTRLVDVVNLVHAYSPAISKLMKGQLSVADKTWEGIVSTQGSTAKAWANALPLLLNPKGHQALLMNLRNLQTHGLVSPEVATALEVGAKQGKQLPFRYYSAYLQSKAAGAPGYLLDAIENCLTQSIENIPVFKGKVMSLVDNSGSAQRATTSQLGTVKVSTIANLSGILTAKVSDEGYLGVFGDKLDVKNIRKNTSVFDELAHAEQAAEKVGTGTENGIWLFLDNAIKTKEHWDHIFVYSDMQAGHGGLYGIDPLQYRDYVFNHRYINVAKLISDYRKKVNPNVMVYLVQVAGYSDTLVPDFYDKTIIMGGWSTSTLSFAAHMAQLHQGQ